MCFLIKSFFISIRNRRLEFVGKIHQSIIITSQKFYLYFLPCLLPLLYLEGCTPAKVWSGAEYPVPAPVGAPYPELAPEGAEYPESAPLGAP